MKQIIVLLACAVLSLAAAKPRSLFDGKSFKGWEGNLKVFRIADRAIVGGTLQAALPHNEFLCTEQRYADFILRAQFRLRGANVNAGIQFRSERIPNNHEVIGYQADLGQTYWGALYDESRRNKILAGPDLKMLDKVLRRDDWNDYVIRCEGKRIRLEINGYQTVDYTEPDDQIRQSGVICLQIHGGPPAEAWYRNITIEELPPRK